MRQSAAQELTSGPLSYREEVAWNEFNTDFDTFLRRGAVLDVDLPDHVKPADLIDTICARHAIFRTAYDTVAGNPVRHVLPAHPHAIAEGGEEPDRSWHGYLNPDDLIRIRRASGLSGGTTLSFELNEMITDPWSCARLRAEIESLVRGEELPPLDLSYAGYAREERERQLPEATETFWRGQLAGAEPAPLPPPDGPDPSGDPAGERILVFPDELTEALRTVCRRTRTSPFMVVTTLVTSAIARLTGERDVTVSTVGSTRPRGCAGVQGNFTNLIPLRTILPTGGDFDAAVSATRDATLGVMARPVPYLRLAELTGGALPRPPVRVHYLPSRAHHYGRALDDRPSGAAWVEETDFAEWPLDLGFAEDGHQRVAVWASYDARRYTHATVETLVETCRRELAATLGVSLQPS